MPIVAFWKLRRLAPRAKRIVERRAHDGAAMAGFARTVPPKVDSFVAAYDGCARYPAAWRRHLAEGSGALATLLAVIRGWLPLVVRDVPGFSSSDYGDKPGVPDDVLDDGGYLRDFISEARCRDGNVLPYRDACLQQLDAALLEAEREWSAPVDAGEQYVALLDAVRRTGGALEGELIALRKHIGAQSGRNDRDYQKLRSERATLRDEDDDPDIGPPPMNISPAPSTARGPLYLVTVAVAEARRHCGPAR